MDSLVLGHGHAFSKANSRTTRCTGCMLPDPVSNPERRERTENKGETIGCAPSSRRFQARPWQLEDTLVLGRGLS
jgi:hypothetical protein